MDAPDLWRQDASALSRLIQSREVTPAEVLASSLERLDRFEPALNAFATVDRIGALQAAEAATERQRKGTRLGPLDGIPVSIKDNLYVGGLPASWGSLLFKDHKAPQDDIVVERLRAGGAVIIGKTTTPEFALMQRTQSRLKGITRNPWDTKLTPGGSSGGAAASVAVGVTPLAIGTDAGGSIRMPAAYTGLVGLRPSNGRVPRRYGFLPMALDFQAIGLMCRTMADLDLMCAVLSGPDRRDPASVNLPPLTRPEGTLRVGWFTHIGDEGCDPEVVESHREARDILASRGHVLIECDPPFDIQELRAIWDVLTAVGAARAAIGHPSWEAEVTDPIAELVRRGAAMLATDYVRTLDRLQAFRAEISAHWGEFDAILTPTTPAPAWPAEQACPATIGERPGSPATQGMFGGWVNAMGYAGLNVPGRPHPDGRPIGLQIVAPFGRDGTALEIGRQIESGAEWKDRWPALATAPA